MTATHGVLVAICVSLATASMASAAPDDVDAAITRATESVKAGSPTRAADLAALLDRLRESRNPVGQIKLIDAVGTLGDAEGASPPAVKASLLAFAPGLLLGMIRSGDDWSVRGEALQCLRSLDAPDDVLDQAIATAKADTGDHAGFIHGRAAMLQTWRIDRPDAPGRRPLAGPDAQRRAADALREQGMAVSYDALADAIGQGKAATVATLLEAGLDVGTADARRASTAVINGLSSACVLQPVPSQGVAEALSDLAGHGFPLDFTDESGNTILMSAAQFCPVPVADRLLVLGALVDPVNKQRFTPLQMALVSGKWDVAKLLVDHGARVTAKQADQIFFEPPQEQAQRDLLKRATR